MKNARGASVVEYILLAGVVALLGVLAFTLFGNSVRNKTEAQGGDVTTVGTP